MGKRKAMTSEQARKVRQAGHDDAKEFAHLIGLSDDYQNDPQAKKDVIDLDGDAHSVKSGKKKWQIFLYSLKRFDTDIIFKRLNGLGELFLEIIKVFPEQRSEYLENKNYYKSLLSQKMINLKDKLSFRETLEAFLDKSFFNAGEVQYLTIKQNDIFHVFHRDDVLSVLTEEISVENSRGNQKVIFKVNNTNPKTAKRFPKITIGEIEMRNDSNVHYREIKFWMRKGLTFGILTNKITKIKNPKPKLKIFGKAIKKFKKY